MSKWVKVGYRRTDLGIAETSFSGPPPAGVERREQGKKAKDDEITPIAKRAPKRTQLKPGKGW
jgi:hypothetical protein